MEGKSPTVQTVITLDWGLVNNSVVNIPSLWQRRQMKRKKQNKTKEDIMLKDISKLELIFLLNNLPRC